MLFLAFLACIPTGTLRLLQPPAAITHSRRLRATVVCKKKADPWASLDTASLETAMYSFEDFDSDDEENSGDMEGAHTKKTKRKGKDGNDYFRTGPKLSKRTTKLAAKGKESNALDAATRNVETINTMDTMNIMSNARLRIEERKKGGKKLTIIRGLALLPIERCKEILRDIKQALSVGGRVNAQGDLEIQGFHTDVCILRLKKAGFNDVKLSGGAGSKKPSKAAWNAPKEVRQLAEARKQSAKRAEAKAKEAKRAAARKPAAVAAKMLSQLRASEQQEVAKLRRSDLPKADKRLAKEKLERIQQRIAEAS